MTAMVSPTVSEHRVRLRSRRRTTSVIKLHLPITPTWLTIIGAIVLGGVAVAMSILGFTLIVLLMNLVYLGLLVHLKLNMNRTGPYWNVPFSQHPESRPMRGWRRRR